MFREALRDELDGAVWARLYDSLATKRRTMAARSKYETTCESAINYHISQFLICIQYVFMLI